VIVCTSDMTIRCEARDADGHSRHNNGLGPGFIVSSSEDGSLVWCQLDPIDISRLKKDESKVPKSLFNKFLLLFSRSPRSGRHGFRPLLPFFVPSFQGTSRRGATPTRSHSTAEAIKDLNPFNLPIKTPRRKPSERDVPSRMKNPVRRFRNDGNSPGEAELIHRRFDPPTDLSRIICKDLPDFGSANVRGREDDRKVFVSVG